MSRARFCRLMAAGLLFAAGGPAGAAGFATILGFDGADGAMPTGGLLAAPSGALYLATNGGGPANRGAIDRLTPPAKVGTPWPVTMLHGFTVVAGGAGPLTGLVADAGGALYGTTKAGGTYTPNCFHGCGAVFRLSPPTRPGAAWSAAVLHAFAGGTADGYEPYGGVIIDASGALYGTTSYGGANGSGMVFRLAPPAKAGGPWQETLLYSFAKVAVGDTDGAFPQGGLTAGKGGVLYGTTYYEGGNQAGAAFALAPPAKAGQAWSETVIYHFGTGSTDSRFPAGALALGRDGVLYGTAGGGGASNGGTVYALTPPVRAGAAWTETILHGFAGTDGIGPGGRLVLAPSGTLYGTTVQGGDGSACLGAGCGTVFALAPPASAGRPWSLAVLHRFSGQGDGATPVCDLLRDAAGTLYGTTELGGQAGDDGWGGYGTVFAVTP